MVGSMREDKHEKSSRKERKSEKKGAKELGFSTRSIHAGQAPDRLTGSVVVPIYQTSTYEQDALGKSRGYIYSRTDNPTRHALEECLASLDHAKHGVAFSSGLAAINAVLTLYDPGDHIVCAEDVYGGTYRLFERILKPKGYEVTFIDGRDPMNFERASKKNTKLFWLETPSNPLLNLADIFSVADIARSRKINLAVDNTFATPYLQQPHMLGADFAVYSTTKYLGGHSDVVSGAVTVSDEKLYERLKYVQNSAGAIPGPFDCWLVLRGIKTLAMRMEAHSLNALRIAEFLEKHKKVEMVLYPGLESNPQHYIAKKQMREYGGMCSFVVKGGLESARKVVEGTKIFTLAESLGGVESLIEHPAVMTHSSMPRDEREKRGITDGLIRLSVGIEDGDDLIADLEQALKNA